MFKANTYYINIQIILGKSVNLQSLYTGFQKLVRERKRREGGGSQ
jgi:hypothetical protein